MKEKSAPKQTIQGDGFKHPESVDNQIHTPTGPTSEDVSIERGIYKEHHQAENSPVPASVMYLLDQGIRREGDRNPQVSVPCPHRHLHMYSPQLDRQYAPPGPSQLLLGAGEIGLKIWGKKLEELSPLTQVLDVNIWPGLHFFLYAISPVDGSAMFSPYYPSASAKKA